MKPSKRVMKIFEQIENNRKFKSKPEVFILANATEPHLDASFFYISGFPYGLFENSFLIGRNDGTISVLTSPLEEDIANKYADGIQVSTEKDEEAMGSKLRKLVGNPKTIGVNSSELDLENYFKIKSSFKRAAVVDVAEAIAYSRAIKDQSEIEKIKKACDIASRTYSKIPVMLKDRISESEIAAKIAFEMQND